MKKLYIRQIPKVSENFLYIDTPAAPEAVEKSKKINFHIKNTLFRLMVSDSRVIIDNNGSQRGRVNSEADVIAFVTRLLDVSDLDDEDRLIISDVYARLDI